MATQETPELNPTVPSEEGDDDVEAVASRGASIGRFVVLGALGMGGMGMVLSAYDPQLDRKVALKILRNERPLGGESHTPAPLATVLVREAQAMARLTHPNVVTVYEVGLSEENAYLVMEQVEGATMRAWLAEGPRPWREVFDLLTATGDGLAAAHRAGIIHQDFKPENVLVGKDGRPRVSDFGLASTPARGAGTPAYMAPEQRDAETVDARADQYAFCMTFWEALEGERPSADPPLPASRRAPAWVYRALARGLATQPERRWPSMDALLGALRRRARAGVSGTVVAGAVVLVGIAAFVAGRDRAASDPCGGLEARLGGVWDPARREAVRAAFAASGVSFRDAAWRGASARLDDYRARWLAMASETCRATRVEGRQSDSLMDLRMACLERGRGVLGELAGLWARGVDADAAARAIDAAAGLPPLAECADTRALAERAPLPADPAAVARIAAVRSRLAAVQALALAGRRIQARDLAAAARAEADATGWPQVRAETSFAEGDILSRLGDPAAEGHLLAAARLAGASHDDRLAARALIELTGSIAADQQRADRALLVADLAEGAVARAGGDTFLAARLGRVRGEALLTAARYAEARAAATASHAIFSAARGPHDSETLTSLSLLARIAQGEGDVAGARRLFEEHLQALLPILGEDDPRVAVSLSNLATAFDQAGDHQGAIGQYRRALAIKERTLGPDALSTAHTVNNLGAALLATGEVEEASALLERALAIREKAVGKSHALVAMTLTNLASARRLQGRTREATDLLQRALAIATEVYGAQHASIGYPLMNLGDVLVASGDPAGALAQYRRAQGIWERELGATHPQTLRAHSFIAGALARLGRCGEARPQLARAGAGAEPEEARAVEGRCGRAAAAR